MGYFICIVLFLFAVPLGVSELEAEVPQAFHLLNAVELTPQFSFQDS